jgi:hypothetical protein
MKSQKPIVPPGQVQRLVRRALRAEYAKLHQGSHAMTAFTVPS